MMEQRKSETNIIHDFTGIMRQLEEQHRNGGGEGGGSERFSGGPGSRLNGLKVANLKDKKYTT